MLSKVKEVVGTGGVHATWDLLFCTLIQNMTTVSKADEIGDGCGCFAFLETQEDFLLLPLETRPFLQNRGATDWFTCY